MMGIIWAPAGESSARSRSQSVMEPRNENGGRRLKEGKGLGTKDRYADRQTGSQKTADSKQVCMPFTLWLVFL